MGKSKYLKITALVGLSILFFTAIILAQTVEVKEKSANLIAGKSATDAVVAFANAQNIVDTQNSLLNAGPMAFNDTQAVPSLPVLHNFSFTCPDPADPIYKKVQVVVQGSNILISNSTGTNWPVTHYLDATSGNARMTCYFGYNYAPYGAGYDAELRIQLSIVERGITLLSAPNSDQVAKSNLTLVRDCLNYYLYKYADFTSGALDQKGNGTILTRTAGVVTLYNYRKNILEDGYAIDLKSDKVYMVNKSGTLVEITDDRAEHKALIKALQAVKKIVKKESDSGERASAVMLMKQIRELANTR